MDSFLKSKGMKSSPPIGKKCKAATERLVRPLGASLDAIKKARQPLASKWGKGSQVPLAHTIAATGVIWCLCDAYGNLCSSNGLKNVGLMFKDMFPEAGLKTLK